MKKYFELLQNQKYIEAKEYRKKLIPQKLVKYVSLTNDNESNEKKFFSLENNMAWFSSIKTLNDPYEFKCMYIDVKKLEAANYDKVLIDAFKNYLKDQEDSWTVLSLSNAGIESLPMWAYYSNNHKGFCIEYTVEDPELIYPVSYEQKRVPIASIIAGMFSEFEQAYNNHEPLSLDALFYACVMRYQFLMKHVSWKHEEEYRIIYPFVTNIGNNMLINKIGLRTSRIVAGINCSDEHKKRLNAISQKINCGSIKEAQISDTEYILIK